MKSVFLSVFWALCGNLTNAAAGDAAIPASWEHLNCYPNTLGLTLEASKDALRVCEQGTEKIRIPILSTSANVSLLLNQALQKTHQVFNVSKEGKTYIIDVLHSSGSTPLMFRAAPKAVAAGLGGIVVYLAEPARDFLQSIREVDFNFNPEDQSGHLDIKTTQKYLSAKVINLGNSSESTCDSSVDKK